MADIETGAADTLAHFFGQTPRVFENLATWRFEMHLKNRFISKWLAVLVCVGTVGGRVSAQSPTNQSVDVILALDNSGSMKQNDPDRLLKQAVVSFASRLRDDSQLGVVMFDERVELLLGLTSLSDPSFKERLSTALKHVNYSGKWTDIPGGIERAIYTLNHDGRAGSRRAVVFFTDGIIETGNQAKDLERARWLRENLAVEARDRGIRIFGVAFTETADYELIESVAQVSGGEHYRVLKPSDIDDAFARVSQRLLEPPPVEAQKPSATAPPQESSRPVRWALAAVVVIAAVAIFAVILVKRRGSGPSDPGLLEIPQNDFAYLIDIGKNSGADRVPLRKRRVRIGRDKQLNDVCIPQNTVTSQHAVIEYRDGSFFLRDLRSSNGTFVNGKRMSDPDAIREVNLKPGDHIRFDAFEFVFNLDALGAGAATGNGDAVQRQRTVLRRDPAGRAPQEQGGAVGLQERKLPAPTIAKAASRLDEPAATRVRNEFCAVHPDSKATELCPKCGVGKCKACMTSKDGSPMCIECAAQTH
jgi:pSer/pThr/pTyr-binding forkhead associated (FHA) protein/Mg-chelatase subunit ChlD